MITKNQEQVIMLIEKLLVDYLHQQAFELVEIEYVKESNNWYLRIYIDKTEGIDIEDCSQVSEFLSHQLDLHDPIPNAYFLEVSSPGAERPLKKKEDFLKSINHNIYLTTYEPIETKKEFEGILSNFDGETLEIKTGKQLTLIPFQKIATARRSVMF